MKVREDNRGESKSEGGGAETKRDTSHDAHVAAVL